LNIIPLYGRGVHNEKGEYNFHNYGRLDESLNAIGRNHLHEIFMKKIEENSLIKFYKGARIENINFEKGIIEIVG
jgi:hypothetical protein